MTPVTLESLANRVEALENELRAFKAKSPPAKDWRLSLGIFEESEFTEDRIAETLAIVYGQVTTRHEDCMSSWKV